MKKSKKILVLGIGQSNFLNQLYENIEIENTSLNIDIDGYFDISKGKKANDSFKYNQYFDFKNIKISKIDRIKSVFQLFGLPFFWKILFFEIKQGNVLKKIIKTIKDFSRAKLTVEKHILPLNHDLIHFHFCIPENLRHLFFLPKNIKSICSFWGSDLLRNNGVSNVFYMKMALKNASVITIQTNELAEILYSKYGREFASKTQMLTFTLNTKIFDFIDEFQSNEVKINEFKTQYGIPLNKQVIAVAHNGFKENNHLQIIDELAKLPENIKDKIVVILPFAYGKSQTYYNQIVSKTNSIDGLNFVFLQDYFAEKEIALLRLSTNIMIQMPVSDALSAAMTEVLYAENSVIAGSWLPYGLLTRNGIVFEKIENFNEIVPKIISILHSSESTKNSEQIKKLLFPEVTIPKWNNLFKKILNE